MDIGHFYFLAPKYFKDFPNPRFMDDHDKSEEQPHNRPWFCAFTENETVYWIIPISSKVNKFEKIYKSKLERYGRCDTIDFCNVLGHKKAVLIQNMCPVTKSFILNEYLDTQKVAVRLSDKTRKRIIHKAKKVLALHRNGFGLIFGDVLEIEKQLMD